MPIKNSTANKIASSIRFTFKENTSTSKSENPPYLLYFSFEAPMEQPGSQIGSGNDMDMIKSYGGSSENQQHKEVISFNSFSIHTRSDPFSFKVVSL